jgi:antitoxin PrlF
MGTATTVRKAISKRPIAVESRTGARQRHPEAVEPATSDLPEAYVPFSSRVSSKSRISSKGQLTLPALVRERLGVKAGDAVEFFFDGERTVVRPVRDEKNPFKKWIGIAKGACESEEALIAWEREMRGYDEGDV